MSAVLKFPSSSSSYDTSYSPLLNSTLRDPLENNRLNNNVLHHLDESDIFICDPVSMEKMVDPVIDQGGHTFSRSTITDLQYKEKSEKGLPSLPLKVKCPLADEEEIDITRLIPNLYAKAAIEHIEKDKICTESLLRVSSVPEKDIAIQSLTKSMTNMSKEMLILNRKIDILTSELEICMTRDRVKSRQLDNIAEMTMTDKFWVTFGPYLGHPNYLKIIRNRGISKELLDTI